jgi:hypothetical protein
MLRDIMHRWCAVTMYQWYTTVYSNCKLYMLEYAQLKTEPIVSVTELKRLVEVVILMR